MPKNENIMKEMEIYVVQEICGQYEDAHVRAFAAYTSLDKAKAVAAELNRTTSELADAYNKCENYHELTDKVFAAHLKMRDPELLERATELFEREKVETLTVEEDEVLDRYDDMFDEFFKNHDSLEFDDAMTRAGLSAEEAGLFGRAVCYVESFFESPYYSVSENPITLYAED